MDCEASASSTNINLTDLSREIPRNCKFLLTLLQGNFAKRLNLYDLMTDILNYVITLSSTVDPYAVSGYFDDFYDLDASNHDKHRFIKTSFSILRCFLRMSLKLKA